MRQGSSIIADDRADQPAWLDRSVNGLRDRAPQLSAQRPFSLSQLAVAGVAGALLLGSMIVFPLGAGKVVVAVLTVLYAVALAYRLLLIWRGFRGETLVRVADEDARGLTDDELPVYTVLVPAYREPEVVAKVLAAVAALDYPAHLLDVRLLLEADDDETIAAVSAVSNHPSVTVVLVPAAEPRTKPKACNYGLMGARGELVTIFDAEDRPEPLQLRRALIALRRLGPRYACVQARLGYFNARQNMLTRWFTLEYGTWFRFFLPGLVALGEPIPLGGTRNHFRADVLRGVGAWDPFNVTEDADLGIRLSRLGFRVGVLDSLTLEEANSDFVNWVKQRSRWYKGYLQTWLVHMREPITVHRQLGWRGALGMHLFVAGTPLMALVNPLFWALSIMWWLDQPGWIQQLFPSAVFYIGFGCFVLGNAAVLYINALTARVVDEPGLVGAALLTPAYWVMMSTAATKAAYQLVRSPSYWEKTAHGLTNEPVETLADVRSAA